MEGVWGQSPPKPLTLSKFEAPNPQQNALEGPKTPLLPLKIVFADLHWSQEWSWELEKNLKSDNYLKIFIPDTMVRDAMP